MPDSPQSEDKLITIREAGFLWGISKDAAWKRISRAKLWTQKGNDGVTKVRRSDVLDLAPEAPSPTPETAIDAEGVESMDKPGQPAVSASDEAIDKLRTELADAEKRAELQKVRATAWKVAYHGEREAKDEAQKRANQAEKRADELRQEIAELKAELKEARKSVFEKTAEVIKSIFSPPKG